MSNSELTDFFKSDIINSQNNNSEVIPIPNGECMFIFNIFKGRDGPVQAFIDSGCNCWVAEGGIPQKELVSVQLEDGPIPINVAGGSTVYALAE